MRRVVKALTSSRPRRRSATIYEVARRAGVSIATVSRVHRLWMLEQLLPHRVAATAIGDGAGDMVQAIGSRDDDGRIAIVAWNGTVDVSKAGGEALLDRSASLRLSGLPRPRYLLRHRRLDETHSNLVASWTEIGAGGDWPDDAQWQRLGAENRLEELEPGRAVEAASGSIELAFDLPMPSVSLIEMTPE